MIFGIQPARVVEWVREAEKEMVELDQTGPDIRSRSRKNALPIFIDHTRRKFLK
jgi:hypothetical protein